MWTHARVRSFGSGRRQLRARSRRAQTQRCRSRKRQSSASRSSAGVRAPDARKGPRLIGKREIDHHDPRRGRRFSAAYFDAAHGLVNLLGRGYQGQGNAAPAAQFGQRRGKPAVVNGVPRSETKMKGFFALSRCSLRSARNSSPVSGCVAGVPFLTTADVDYKGFFGA
jgi:hypothetical protein